MPLPARLAFVDLETTGLCPTTDRIIEVGVVTVDRDRVEEWTTLVNPHGRMRSRSDIANELLRDAPRFKDISAGLAQRLDGRVLIAHNARFDYGFLKAEFRRVGVEFDSPVLCSVMLSRKLYPAFPQHDLDSLMQRHDLRADVRHRALPDAQLIWQFWQAAQREHPHDSLSSTIEKLLAGPVLPADLDSSLIERLPEAPGVYALHGENAVLHAGKAENLKLHLQNYFRIDRASPKASAIAHLVRDITWRVTLGALGARLQLAAWSRMVLPAKQLRADRGLYSWRFTPEASPCVELVSLSDRTAETGPTFGVFDSERKARNELLRLANRNRLCHSLLGIGESPEHPCLGCASDERGAGCGRKFDRLKHLTRAVAALQPLRVEAWPYAGAIGIRERSDLHIIDDWRYLGTAKSEAEVHAILQTRSPTFEKEVFAVLATALPRLSSKRVVRIQRRVKADDQFELHTS